jgi:tRNA pseudouridine13 synthase
LSVPGLEPERARTLTGAGWQVLEAARHDERLRVGELTGNRFRLVVREVTPAEAAVATDRLAEIARRGMSNRFGAQRFGSRRREPAPAAGHGDDNVGLGARLLRGERVPGGRRQQRLYLSALQSAVFNEVLARRPLPPDHLLAGDLALVHASGALLTYTPGDATLEERAARFEVSPTGPLFGTKMRTPRGAARELEQAAYSQFGVPWGPLPRLEGHLLPGGRRPLRTPVGEATATFAGDALELRFTLPPGSYATVLVEELFPGGVAEGPPPLDSQRS